MLSGPRLYLNEMVWIFETAGAAVPHLGERERKKGGKRGWEKERERKRGWEREKEREEEKKVRER